MPEYKKRRRNRLFSSHPRSKVKKERRGKKDYDIEMTNDDKEVKAPKNANMKVVRGKKLEKKKKFKFFSSMMVALLIVVFVLEIIFPAGLIRTLKNTVAVIGTGSYPVELDSSNTIDLKPMGSYYYLLTNTHIYAFSNSGKKIFSHIHGYENPILKVSLYGALVFDRGDTKFSLLNLSGEVTSLDTEKSITTAAISDSGAYSVVTDSDSYASVVLVYNKKGKNIYEWYSAKDTVNNVSIAPNAKKIAVSTFSTNGGEFDSTVSLLNFKSATPENSYTIDGSLVYDISSAATGYFTVASKNGIQFIKWSNFNKNEYKNDYNLLTLRTASHSTVAVWGRESNLYDNIVTVFSKKGEKKYEFKFNGIISDIRLFGGHIYCMSDTDIYLLSESGKKLREASSGFGGVKTVVTGTDTVLTVTDNKIEKIKLEQE